MKTPSEQEPERGRGQGMWITGESLYLLEATLAHLGPTIPETPGTWTAEGKERAERHERGSEA